MGDTSRREVLQTALAAVLSAAVAGTRDVSGQPARRPNILWLVSEDNNPFLGCYGDRLAHTPNIDALAKRGILYRHTFSAAPVCAPSRFGILTGMHAESCAPANQMRANAKMPPFLRTYPEYLREAGYYCTNNAKTDFNCDADPDRIFDESSPTAHYKNRPAGKPFFAVFNHESSHESCLSPADTIVGGGRALGGRSGAGAAAAVRFGGAGMRPAPMSGRVRPEDVRVPAYLPDTPETREDRSRYYNAIEVMDGEIGAKLKELDDAGLADDTIVFYYSDNGGVLPRSKRYCYDDGLRCAMVVAFPPKWVHLAPAKMGSEWTAPVSFVDLAPTLLSLIDVPAPPQMQGTAFLGPRARPRRKYAFGMRNRMDERYDFVRAVTDGRHHYMRNYTAHRVFQQNTTPWTMKSYQSWEREYLAGRLNDVQARFFKGPRPFEELYDLQADPDQVTNLAGVAANAGRLRAMRRTLDDHMLAVNDNGFIPEGMPQEGYLPSRDKVAYPLPRLMAIGEKAGHRDRRNVPEFVSLLGDPNPIVRHWAATGLRILGPEAAPAREKLVAMMRGDAVPQNRIIAAEACACIEQSPEAVAVLASILDADGPMPVKLQAINSLTFIGEQAKAVMPAIKRAAAGSVAYVNRAARYLEAVLEGRYEPGMRLSDGPVVRGGTL